MTTLLALDVSLIRVFITVAVVAFLFAFLYCLPWLLGVRYIAHNRVGIVEKLWSPHGSLKSGGFIALAGEAGYQCDVLRGGLHFCLWPWQYRVFMVPLTVVPQGKIGYVFARDGESLKPEQTLARAVSCNNFQDARAFLAGEGKPGTRGQRGRQRAILREGMYAINLALFVVMTEDTVYRLELRSRDEATTVQKWQNELREVNGFDPAVVGSRSSEGHRTGMNMEETDIGDNIAIVTVQDGPSVEPGEIIAAPVAMHADDPNYHNNFQDIEAFLRAGGRRGRQFLPLTDGTYFLNRWFATVDLIPKTVVPIGYVGVVVSYYGKKGKDLSGDTFRHGETVMEGAQGVQQVTLGPGKYPFNTYAGHVHLVPTTNFVLHWITGRSEAHKFDESLKSIDLVTADAYEPMLPLSVVVHIDYQKAPKLVQRFGDVKKLITQTLDPLLSAYFRDIAHKKTMLELLHDRDVIQGQARAELRAKFAEFDIELVDVLIGKPLTTEASGEIETLLEQLRLRQLSREQILTYEQQCAAADKLKALKMAQAAADKQAELTNSLVQVQIAENQGQAELSRARKQAEQSVVMADAESKRRFMLAEAEGRSLTAVGEGEGQATLARGKADAAVLELKIKSYVDPKLYATSIVAQHLAQSQQPLVPERVFITHANGSQNGHASPENGMLSMLLQVLLAERTGFQANGEATPAAKVETSTLAKAELKR